MSFYTVIGCNYPDHTYQKEHLGPRITHIEADSEREAVLIASENRLFLAQRRLDEALGNDPLENIVAIEEPPEHDCPYDEFEAKVLLVRNSLEV